MCRVVLWAELRHTCWGCAFRAVLLFRRWTGCASGAVFSPPPPPPPPRLALKLLHTTGVGGADLPGRESCNFQENEPPDISNFRSDELSAWVEPARPQAGAVTLRVVPRHDCCSHDVVFYTKTKRGAGTPCRAIPVKIPPLEFWAEHFQRSRAGELLWLPAGWLVTQVRAHWFAFSLPRQQSGQTSHG